MMTDFSAPVVLHDNAPSTEDFCNRLHKQLMMQFKYAWVWGSSVRHQPQKVTLTLLLPIYFNFAVIFILRHEGLLQIKSYHIFHSKLLFDFP